METILGRDTVFCIAIRYGLEGPGIEYLTHWVSPRFLGSSFLTRTSRSGRVKNTRQLYDFWSIWLTTCVLPSGRYPRQSVRTSREGHDGKHMKTRGGWPIVATTSASFEKGQFSPWHQQHKSECKAAGRSKMPYRWRIVTVKDIIVPLNKRGSVCTSHYRCHSL